MCWAHIVIVQTIGRLSPPSLLSESLHHFEHFHNGTIYSFLLTITLLQTCVPENTKTQNTSGTKLIKTQYAAKVIVFPKMLTTNFIT